MNLDDLRTLLDERSDATPSAASDHARRMAGVRYRVRVRRRRLAAAPVAAALVVLVGVAAVALPQPRGNTVVPQQSAPAASVAGSPTPTPAPSPTPSVLPSTAVRSPSAAFPDPTRTGVPSGTALTRYPGPCTITAANTVIDARTVTCDLSIRAPGVVVKRSRVTGTVTTTDDGSSSVTIQDSEITGGGVSDVVRGTGLTVLRSTVRGGTTSVHCIADCVVRDSSLNSFLANDDGPRGRTNAVLTHNTIACSGAPGSADAGCSGDVKLFADFGPLSGITFEGNLFGASTATAYCVFGGSNASKPHTADHITFVDNVFQRGSNGRCGGYGPVTDFDPGRPGNRWSGNTWDDGTPISPG